MSEAETIAFSLTKAQQDALVAIKPGEQARAINYSGSIARNLCWSTQSRPALLSASKAASGRVWFEHTAAGLAVRSILTEPAPGGGS